MYCLILKASDDLFREVRFINNFCDLFSIYDSLIIDKSDYTLHIYRKFYKRLCKHFDCVITIYDDYIE